MKIPLKKTDQAIEILEGLTEGPGQWAMRATASLWGIRLERDELDSAMVLFEKMHTRYALEKIAWTVPYAIRETALNQYGERLVESFFDGDPKKSIKHLEQMLSLAEALHVSIPQRRDLTFYLLRGYEIDGQDEVAFRRSRDFLRKLKDEGYPSSRELSVMRVCRIYCRTMIARNAPGDAASDLISFWIGNVENPNYRAHVVLEKIRLHIALGEWQRAEEDLQLCLESLGKHAWRRNHRDSRAIFQELCLLEGFLLERNEDPQAAKEAWRRGYRVYAHGEFNNRTPFDRLAPVVSDLLPTLMLGALCGELTDEDGEEFQRLAIEWFTQLTGKSRPNSLVSLFERRIPISGQTLRRLWVQEKARGFAKNYAFGRLSLREIVRFPLVLSASDMILEKCLGHDLPSKDQQTLSWELAEELLDALLRGELGLEEVLNIVFAWNPNVIDPSLSAKTSYFLGCWWLYVAKDRKRATVFFEIALANAKPGSLLEKLSVVETSGSRRAPAGPPVPDSEPHLKESRTESVRKK